MCVYFLIVSKSLPCGDHARHRGSSSGRAFLHTWMVAKKAKVAKFRENRTNPACTPVVSSHLPSALMHIRCRGALCIKDKNTFKTSGGGLFIFLCNFSSSAYTMGLYTRKLVEVQHREATPSRVTGLHFDSFDFSRGFAGYSSTWKEPINYPRQFDAACVKIAFESSNWYPKKVLQRVSQKTLRPIGQVKSWPPSKKYTRPSTFGIRAPERSLYSWCMLLRKTGREKDRDSSPYRWHRFPLFPVHNLVRFTPSLATTLLPLTSFVVSLPPGFLGGVRRAHVEISVHSRQRWTQQSEREGKCAARYKTQNMPDNQSPGKSTLGPDHGAAGRSGQTTRLRLPRRSGWRRRRGVRWNVV